MRSEVAVEAGKEARLIASRADDRIVLVGAFDVAGASEVASLLATFDGREATVDLTAVTAIDVAGMAALLRCGGEGVTLRFVGLQPSVRRGLDISISGDGASAAIAMFDREMRYLAASPQWLKDLGLTAAPLGLSHYDLFGESAEQWRDIHQRALRGESFHSDGAWMQRSNSAGQWLKWDVMPWHLPQGDVGGIIIAAEDTTQRVQTEADLRHSRDTFRLLVENSPFGIYVIDSDFRVVQVSAGAQPVFSNVRPLLGRDFAEVLRIIWPEPFATEAIERFRHTLRSGDSYHAPSTVERRLDLDQVDSYDWKIERLILPDGRPGVVCHFYDLSERVRYESALQKREDQLRQAMAAADAGSWSLVADTGEFIASARALELHGLPSGTPMTHATALARVHPDDRPTIEAAVRHALRTGAPMRTEHRVLHADGSISWVASHAERRTEDNGHVLAGLVQDITSRKEAESALRAVHAREHEIALSLQRALLPQHLEHPHVDLASRYVAGSDSLVVGGDWYDVIELDGGRMGITVGDVVGHGLQAAVAMGQLRTAVSVLAPGRSPRELIEALDSFVARSRVTEFATVFYGLYDPTKAELTYASAGHPPTLLMSPGSALRRLDAVQTAPLCVPHRVRREASINVPAGSQLVMYTDGLIERRGRDIFEGLARLEAAAEATAHLPLPDACDAILRSLDVDDSTADDVVLLVARFADGPPRL